MIFCLESLALREQDGRDVKFLNRPYALSPVPLLLVVVAEGTGKEPTPRWAKEGDEAK